MKLISKIKWLFLILLVIELNPCFSQNGYLLKASDRLNLINDSLPKKIVINKDVTIENYFHYLDSIVTKYDSITSYKLTEHLLVRANFWIINTLENTDYYKMMERDLFVYDQKQLVVLPKESILTIPDSDIANQIINSFQKTTLEINIPEFKLRIYEGSYLLYEFPIRVGKNEKKYLEMSGRIQDLRTITGTGYIVNHNRYPKYFNPVNNHEYFVTKRDDNKVTKLPQIPFIETEINGIRNGQLIHPTTNLNTLGKAYSNGCIGTRESDAWTIYYHAPVGTKIKIKYDIKVNIDIDKILTLNDIYGYNIN